jgi:hypothetical protein
MADTKEKYAVIGGGPAGLSGCKNLKDKNIPFDAFEAAEDLGGLWNISNSNSTVYESAHLISSKRMTEFLDFPMKDEVADYPHHTAMLEYFKDYAKHFGLYEHYRFNTKITGVEPENGFWKVTTDKGDSNLYKGVIIANGCLTHPNIPKIPGTFTGELLHSSQYKSPAIFEGKRVLVVGAGNSGCDIVVDAVHRAKTVDLSVRRGYHFVPKYLFGKPADTIGGKVKLPKFLKQKFDKWLLNAVFVENPQKLGFPEPDHEIYESHPIVNTLVLYHLGHGDITIQKDVEKFDGKLVYFKDGSSKEYDLVLLATGYKLFYPFIDKKHLNWKEGENAPNLFMNIFTPQHDNLFVLGMVEATGLGWEGRNKQAELVVEFISSKTKKPEKAAKLTKLFQTTLPDLKGGYNYMKVDRMAYYVHKDTYLNALKKHKKLLN